MTNKEKLARLVGWKVDWKGILINKIEELEAVQAENKRLREALMDMVIQHFSLSEPDPENQPDGVWLCHSFMRCDEDAIELLIELGYAEKASDNPLRFRMHWDALATGEGKEQ